MFSWATEESFPPPSCTYKALNPLHLPLSYRLPGYIVRFEPGVHPPYTCKAEIYNVPAGTSTPKGVSVDRETGII